MTGTRAFSITQNEASVRSTRSRLKRGYTSVLLALMLSFIATLGVGSSAIAMGDELPVAVSDILETNDGRTSTPTVILLSDGVQDIEIVAEVLRADGTRIGTVKRSGRSIVPIGTTAGVDTMVALLGSAIEFPETRSDVLVDGLYVERIEIDVFVEDTEFAKKVVQPRYFEVSKGRVTPMTSTEYSKLTTIIDPTGKSRSGPAIKNSRSVQLSNAEQLHSGDTKN